MRKPLVISGFATLILLLLGSVIQWHRANEARAAAETHALELDLRSHCPPQPTTREEIVARVKRDLDTLGIHDIKSMEDGGRPSLGDSPPWYGVEPPSPTRPGPTTP
jgi:hypothetical protein